MIAYECMNGYSMSHNFNCKYGEQHANNENIYSK